jgi:chaperone modulatory protein CbpM
MMIMDEYIDGVLLEEAALTCDELARACAVEPDWVVRHVKSGVLLHDVGGQPTMWRFTSVDLVRARRLAQVERDFEANEDVAALVVDLHEEVRRLRARLHAAGLMA